MLGEEHKNTLTSLNAIGVVLQYEDTKLCARHLARLLKDIEDKEKTSENVAPTPSPTRPPPTPDAKDKTITAKIEEIKAKDTGEDEMRKVIAAKIEKIKAKDEEIQAHKDIATGLRAENSALGAEVTRLKSVVVSPAFGKRKRDDSEGGSGLRALVALNKLHKAAVIKIKREEADAKRERPTLRRGRLTSRGRKRQSRTSTRTLVISTWM